MKALTKKDQRRSAQLPLWSGVALAILLLLGSAGFATLRSQNLAPGQKLDSSLLQWPRFFSTNGYDYAVYQPMIGQWPGNQIDGRFVVAVRPAGTSNEVYGVLSFTARTEIDKVNRLVTFEDFQITKADFPTQKNLQAQYLALFQSIQPHCAKVVPLDHLEAVFAASGDVARAKVQSVRNDPPRILYSTQPALLILVDGAPILQPLTGTYQRIVNTRAILLFNQDPSAPRYWLYAANRWFAAPAVQGPWVAADFTPSDINTALEAALATKQVDPMAPKDPAAVPQNLLIYVSTVPAELLVTDGQPNLLSMPTNDLLYVSNTSNAIFYYLDDGNYYVLISGRWFKAAGLNGPWTFVPPSQLPSDFQRIPADNPKSNVMASVPGTPQAQEAVIANSIPQTATIDRAQAQLTVAYQGAPSFVPIAGTTLAYAANTTTPVIMVSPTLYYACQAGVWFVSSSTQGPWTVATSVPSVVYTIPASCPIHYVTYAYVYGYTPSVVYVGYTPGYVGTVVAPGGVVVYGTGYYYPPVVVGTTYISYPPTYGYGASLAVGAAVGFALGYAAGSSCSCWCEPYWGCYAVAAPYSYTHVNVNATSFYTSWGTAVHATGAYGYNPYTGTSWAGQRATTYNPYTGTSGVVGREAAYNPYTGNAAAARGGSWYNPYSGASAQASGWGTANRYTGNYSGGREASGYNPTTGRYGAGQTTVSGNYYNGTASVSSRGVAGNTQTGNAVAWNNGNMYADKNGNIYSYNQSSGAQKYNTTTDSWQSASKPSNYSQSSWGSTASQSTWGGKAAEQSSWSQRASSSSWGGSSSWANRAGGAQFTGSQRFDGWSGSGGGWGGQRGGGRRR